MTQRKIDIFNHVAPKPYLDLLREMLPKGHGIIKRLSGLPMLHDLEARVRMMDQWPGYQQVLTIAAPPVESVVSAADAKMLVRLANDEMKAICATRPDKFPAWVASLPLNDIDASLQEMDRAIAMGASGIQIFSNVAGLPLDRPEFYPIFERATTHHRVPIWMHPFRTVAHPDYLGEDTSLYEIWNVFGWPYETSVAVARLVFSGILDRLPELRLITHHLGGMVPFFGGRIETNWDKLGTRSVGDSNSAILEEMRRKGRRPIDYFRLFYGDTAVGGSAAAIRCGLEFFGDDRVLFGTDCPFDPEGGPLSIREAINAIDSLQLPEGSRQKIYCKNALCMLSREDTVPHDDN